MKTEEQMIETLQEKMDSYNRLAAKWGYAPMWWDLKTRMVRGGCTPYKETVKDTNIFHFIVFVIKDTILNHRYGKVVALNLEMRTAYPDSLKAIEPGKRKTSKTK